MSFEIPSSMHAEEESNNILKQGAKMAENVVEGAAELMTRETRASLAIAGGVMWAALQVLNGMDNKAYAEVETKGFLGVVIEKTKNFYNQLGALEDMFTGNDSKWDDLFGTKKSSPNTKNS